MRTVDTDKHRHVVMNITMIGASLSEPLPCVLYNLASSPGPNFSRKIFIRHTSVVANILHEKFGPGDEAIYMYN